MFGFRLPTHVTIEPGCRRRLAEAVRALGAKSAMLVADPGLRAAGWPERIAADLDAAGITVETFDEVESNPRTTTAERAAEVARERSIGAVVGLGGGSVLDAAKAAAMLATNPGLAEDFEGRNRFTAEPLPFVAVPTTCGTGSEVTWVSVLSHEASRRKISLKGDGMFPDVALVDAELVATLPPQLVAWTGIDALTHALEAFTCNRANPVSDALAAEAIRLLFHHLERAVRPDGVGTEARAIVLRASTLAGIAFGNADVAAVHCLSETLGGLYDVAHGLANAVLLAPVLRYQLAANEGRLALLAPSVTPGIDRRMPENELAVRFLEQLDGLVARLGIPGFGSLGVPRADRAEIAQLATRNGSNDSNPMPMAPADYLAILDRLPFEIHTA